jgi:CRISPR-associated protein Cmr6
LPNQKKSSHGDHAGLILNRYLKHAVQKGAEQAKDDLFEAARASLGVKRVQAIYKMAFERWQASLPAGALVQKFSCASPLIIGLGGENVTETGLTLHHTYGVPYLPGSALKGVAARYARRVWGAGEPSWHPDTKPLDQPNQFRTMFGTTGEGGLVNFLDGWITDTSLKNCLVDDVLTPHHGDYYMKEEREVREPTDFDNPVPVPFLAVRGAFLVAICKRDPSLPDEWLKTAAQLLANGLSEFGLGGKTNAGYGRLIAEQPRDSAAQPDSVAGEPAEPEIELLVIGMNVAGGLEVMTSDGRDGVIVNLEDVPPELRAEEARLIGRQVASDNLGNVQFEYLRPAD